MNCNQTFSHFKKFSYIEILISKQCTLNQGRLYSKEAEYIYRITTMIKAFFVLSLKVPSEQGNLFLFLKDNENKCGSCFMPTHCGK